MDIRDSTAVVTGAASGLGAATAAELVARGARVIGLDLPQVVHAAAPVDGVHYVSADVTDEDQVRAAVATAADVAPLRTVVNCAGIGTSARVVGKNGVHDLALFERVVRINLVGTFTVLALAAEVMTAQEPVDETVPVLHGLRAELTHVVVVLGRCGADHPRAERLGDLHAHAPHTTGGRVDQHGLALRETQSGEHLVRGESRERQPSGLFPGKTLRLGGECAHGDRDVLGKRAAVDPVLAGVGDHLIALGDAGGVEALAHDDARDVPAGGRRELDGHHGIQPAGHDLPVHRVDARGLHLHQDLAGAYLGHGLVGELQYGGVAVLLICLRLHCGHV
ncbi:SDR family NAD(P)-dependent oxidoreductase, partial [Streptomyces sp. tea 10]|nr:SDR family NAD(P)-dependent oxidoreductase [Streptomyces sp. tea 10]